MQRHSPRRTATRVQHGSVQKKNRHTPTTHAGLVIDRESPGAGYRHVVSKEDLQRFLELLPHWPRWSHRLERIKLARGSDTDGLHEFYHREGTGAIFLNAWEEDLWPVVAHDYFAEHQAILERLGVAHRVEEQGVRCYFSKEQARAFTLLHVFMHELGHHLDRLAQRHLSASSGEPFAEEFANRHFETLFTCYVEAFGHPGSGGSAA